MAPSAHEALDRNKALCHRVHTQEQALEGYRTEQWRSVRSDEAGGGYFIAVDAETNFRDGPHVALPARGYHGPGPPGNKPEPVRKRSRDDEKSRSGVHDQFYILGAARGTG